MNNLCDLYSAHQIKILESLALKEYNLSESVLMERAGKAAAHILQEKWPNAKYLIVFCGPGNNGGDGYVLARHAVEQGKEVQVFYVGYLDRLKPAARKAYEACIKSNVKISPWREQPISSDVIIDALLGTGFQGELKDEFQSVIKWVKQEAQKEKIPVFSLDIPSGLPADTGYVFKEAVKANCTLTFIGIKKGFFTADGPDYCGEMINNTLDIPNEAYLKVVSQVHVLNLNLLKSCLPARKQNVHKGHFGHVLIVGGSAGMPGSVRMAAESALRVGAGLVTVATDPCHAPFITLERPEVICYGIETPAQLAALINKASVIVVGMGLGQGNFGKMILKEILKSDKPMIVDADALNLLAEISLKKSNWILTPHPGEAARLLHVKVDDIQKNRFQAIESLQQQRGGICVLKGKGTLVKGMQEDIEICSAGHPGMASAGMGDVLAGVIGGLVAQKMSLWEAAKLGVCLHACAGDKAALEKGERGLLAMDLMPYLQQLSNFPEKK